MPNYLIQPEADHTADPTDLTNATWAFGVADPGTVSGLTNGTAYVAREFVLSPASASFTPAAAGATNLVTDPGFDDPAVWGVQPGISITGSKLVLNGTNGNFAPIIESSGDFTALGFTADGTETFEFQIECTRVVTTSGRMRFDFQCYDGPTVTDTFLGSTTPDRLGGSTVTISATGTYGPYSFSVPSGTTHVRVYMTAMDANMDMDFDNASIVQV